MALLPQCIPIRGVQRSLIVEQVGFLIVIEPRNAVYRQTSVCVEAKQKIEQQFAVSLKRNLSASIDSRTATDKIASANLPALSR